MGHQKTNVANKTGQFWGVLAFLLSLLSSSALFSAEDSKNTALDSENKTHEMSEKKQTQSRKSTAQAFRIGVLYWSATIEGQVVMRQGLEAEAARINAGLGRSVKLLIKVAGDGPEGMERQIQQMNDLLDQHIDALIVQPTDAAALAPALKRANRMRVPVIAYDQYILGGKLTAYITSNNRQAGALGGEYIASRFAKDKELRLILIEYPHVSSTVERLNGFLDALKNNQQPYRVLKSYKAVEPIAGKRAGEAILRDFPKKGSVDVIFSVNDGGGLAVVDVLAKAGRTEIQMATIDGDPRSVENIRKGRLTVIDSAQFCASLGEQAMSATYKFLRGGTLPKQLLVPTFPITAETQSRYLGWNAPLPAEFQKPWPSQIPMWSAKAVARMKAPVDGHK